MRIMLEQISATAERFIFSITFFIVYLAMLPALAITGTEDSVPQQSLEEWIRDARLNAHDQPEIFQQQAVQYIKTMEASGSGDVYRIYLAMADASVATGQYSESREYLQKALATNAVQQDPELKVDTLFQVGLSYRDQTNFVKTYEYFALALRHTKEFNLICRELEIKTEIGSLLTDLADYSSANEIMESVPKSSDCPRFTYQIVWARLLAKQGEYDTSFELYEKFLTAASGRDSLVYLTDIKADYVPFLVEAGRLDRAEEVLQDVIEVMKNKGIRHPSGLYEWALATVLSAKGQHEDALKYAKIVLADDVELPRALRIQIDHEVLPLVVNLYQELGKLSEARTMMSRFVANNVEYFSNNRSVLLGVAEARLNVAEREGEIAYMSQEILVNRLKFERLLLISAFVALIAMTFVIWATFLYRRNTKERVLYDALRQKNEALNERAIGAESELEQKETLFHEAHHRLKNNLHFLVSLFEIQRSRLTSSTASKISDVLLDAVNRVHAMAVIHQFSYGADNGGNVSINDLLNNLVEQTFDIGDGLVTINVDCRDVELGDETSKSVVLIVNELLCNAQKHAFDGKKTPHIDIVLGKGVDYENKLMVFDNGKGFRKDLLEQREASMGLKLVRSMVKQLNGTLDVDSGEFGTRWTIEF